jgi:hypothetical protein
MTDNGALDSRRCFGPLAQLHLMPAMMCAANSHDRDVDVPALDCTGDFLVLPTALEVSVSIFVEDTQVVAVRTRVGEFRYDITSARVDISDLVVPLSNFDTQRSGGIRFDAAFLYVG